MVEFGDRLVLGVRERNLKGFLGFCFVSRAGLLFGGREWGGGRRLVSGMLDWRYFYLGTRRFRK